MYIFDNLEVMAKISSQLLTDLQERLQTWENSQSNADSLCISDVFTQLVGFSRKSFFFYYKNSKLKNL